METGKPKWAGLGYEQVPGLANRIISRYLRGQRRNMERFFTERGLYDSADRMRQIRLSRQGMMAKNRMFQEVLNEYARRATPTAVPQAEDQLGSGPVGAGDVDLPAEGHRTDQPGDGSDRPRADAGGGVQELAVEASGLVIEE